MSGVWSRLARRRRALSFYLPHPSDFHLEDRTVLSNFPGGFQDVLLGLALKPSTAMEFAPDGRLFVTERSGAVRVIQDGQVLPDPFVTVPAENAGERGLGSLAFDPHYHDNGYLYLYYTHLDTQVNRLSRFTARDADPNRADPASELVILDNLPTGAGHLGGGMHFGPDGMLYLGIGDTLNPLTVQDLGALNGKLLRLDVANYPNIVPPDNPFVSTPGARGEVYALGFRNPFTSAFQPGTGRYFVNDVGEHSWEEVNEIVKGGNYGWPLYEGIAAESGFIDPIYVYSHNGGDASVVGGVFYEASQFPEVFQGNYFFGDFNLGFIRRLDPDDGNAVSDFATEVPLAVDLDVGPDGALYYLQFIDDFGSARVHRVAYLGSGNVPPSAAAAADVTAGLASLTVHFSGAAGSIDLDGDALTYAWDFGDGAPVEFGLEVTHVYTQLGQFQARLTVTDSHGAFAQAEPISITVGNSRPVAAIVLPVLDRQYVAGETFIYQGYGTDAQDGFLPDSALTWEVVFHHGQHTHPFLGPFAGVRGGAFTIPTVGETAANVWYRVNLTVTDSGGLQHHTYHDVFPRSVNLTLAANVASLKVNLDGQPHVTPYSVAGVVGVRRTLSAPLFQTANGKLYEFASWSDGQGLVHGISTPATDVTYTAVYQEYAPGAVQVLDNGDAGFTTAGAWFPNSVPDRGFQGDLLQNAAGTGADKATWTLTGLTPGLYRVSASWFGASNRATNAPFTILDGATSLATVRVNQIANPDDFNRLGTAWEDLGGPYALTGNTLVVRLTDAANGIVVADAVRVERLGDLPTAPEIQVLAGATNQDIASDSGRVDLFSTLEGKPLTRTITVRNLGTADLTLSGPIALPAGFSLATGFGATVLPPGAATTFQVRLDAATVGSYGGEVSFGTNDADEALYRFTIRGAVAPLAAVQILDNGDPGYSIVGNWMLNTIPDRGFQGDFHRTAGGGGANQATWTFGGLAPGLYRIASTWYADASRATDTPYTIFDGGAALATIRKSQELAPDDFSHAGANWENLNGLWAVTGNTLSVRLTDLANEIVVADAVLIYRAAELPAGPEIQVLHQDSHLASGKGQVEFGTVWAGAPVERTFTVRNVGNQALTLDGSVLLPAGFSLAAGFGTTVLDPGDETTFVVRLDAQIAGTFGGELSFGSDDADESPFRLTLGGTVSDVRILDDGDTGFAAVGDWAPNLSPNRGYRGDLLNNSPGTGANQASWTFGGLTPGLYQVSTTWFASPSRASNAPFTVFDGANALATVEADQRTPPGDFGTLGAVWSDLGGPYVLTGDTLVARLTDAAAATVTADAVRIRRLGDVPIGPEIQVLVGTSNRDVAGGADVGTAEVGMPLQQTFTVRNLGTADLTLSGPIVLPAGFSLASDFGATVLGPNGVTTFSVRLDAAAAGTYGGEVTFGTNDADEASFGFMLLGVVEAVPTVFIRDDGDVGFSTVGYWTLNTTPDRGFQSDRRQVAAGTGAKAAQWVFAGLEPGQYRVSATWYPFSNRATNAPFTIADGGTVLRAVQVNQQQAPDDFADAETTWEDLGGLVTVAGDKLVVRLTDAANGVVIADAIRIERVGG